MKDTTSVDKRLELWKLKITDELKLKDECECCGRNKHKCGCVLEFVTRDCYVLLVCLTCPQDI